MSAHRNDHRPDLTTPADVRQLVQRFYGQVAQDDVLQHQFTTIAAVNWNEHIDTLTNFWSRILFGLGDYRGNPLASHERVHDRAPFTADHFHRWLELFSDTVDAGWSGANADKVKRVALKVAKLHSLKLLGRSVVEAVPQEGLVMIETRQPAR